MATKQVLLGRTEQIRNIVATAGKPAPPKPATDQKTPLPDEYEGDFRYINEKHDETSNIGTVLHLGLNDDLIWPGNLIQGSQINDFVYIPISLPRAPLTISISAEGSLAGEAVTGTVREPKLSSMRQGIEDVLKKVMGPDTRMAARVDFTKEEVFSESQMNAKFGAAVSYGVGSVKTDFDWDNRKDLTRIVAKYTQIYFTVDVDSPESPADFIAPSASIEQVQYAMPQGSMPLYVSSVSYGMMAMICVETEHSADTMMMALDAAYKGAVDVKVTGELTSKEILQTSKLKVLVYGGSTAGLGEIERGFDGFMKIINASKEFNASSPGVPISYRFRNLLDNSLTFIGLTSQYTLRTPVRTRQKVNIHVSHMECKLSDDEGVNNDADMDRFSITFSAANYSKKEGKRIQIPVADPTIYTWATSGDVTVYKGYYWAVNRSRDVIFNTDPAEFDFSQAVLVISGYGREYDKTSADEEGWGSLTLLGSQFFEKGGCHSFQITSRDAIFEVNVTLSKGTD